MHPLARSFGWLPGLADRLALQGTSLRQPGIAELRGLPQPAYCVAWIAIAFVGWDEAINSHGRAGPMRPFSVP